MPREGREMQVVAAAEAEAEKVIGEAGVGGGVERIKRKKTLGRRKIEIKAIRCMEARHVCFSKRRDGLYKKASELCALTGAKVAVIVYSPAGKPYSFGHPSVTAVVDTNPTTPTTASADADAVTALFEVPPPPLMYEFDGQRDRLLEAIAAEARRKDALEAAARVAGVWTDDVVREAGLHGLVAMVAALERVKDDADRAIRQQYAAAAAVAAAGGVCDAACYYDLVGGDGMSSFMADEFGGGGGASSGGSQHQQQQVAQAMDAHMALLMGGNKGGVSHTAVAHAPPPAYAPMMLPPPDLQPPPAPLAFNYGSDHSHFTGGGYEGCAYDLGDGGGHGAAYETEGCFFGPTATCNFFG